MKIASIAFVTLREALRQKLAVNLLVFALLLTSASIILSSLTFGEQYRIISDLALTSAQLFGTLIAVFLGAGLVAGDVQRRTLYPIIAKPLGRAEYLVGRYLGLVLTLELNLAAMAAASIAVLAVYTGGFGFLHRTPFAAAYLGTGLQFALIGAMAIAFSSLTNVTLAAMFTLALTFAGHFSREMFVYWQHQASPVRALAYVLPNLAGLDYKVEFVYQRAVEGGRLAWAALYALLYVAVVLALACAAFARRDFR